MIPLPTAAAITFRLILARVMIQFIMAVGTEKHNQTKVVTTLQSKPAQVMMKFTTEAITL